jgi:hypothetical protein
VIEFEVIARSTLDRDNRRVSLNRGARLKIDTTDESINWRQVDRLIRDNRLRCTAGRYALAERLDRLTDASSRRG